MFSKHIAIGAIFSGLAIVFGAFGAHGLKDKLDPYHLEIFHTAAQYHLIQGLALILVPVLGSTGTISHRAAKRVFILLTTGLTIFSGSLYVLAISGISKFGAITPVGGSLLILAWFLLAFEAMRTKSERNS